MIDLNTPTGAYILGVIHGDGYISHFKRNHIIGLNTIAAGRQGMNEKAQNEITRPLDEIVSEDICGFCGLSGADKFPHPIRWPGEASAGTKLVHADCEQEECRRAHAQLSELERRSFLSSIR